MSNIFDCIQMYIIQSSVLPSFFFTVEMFLIKWLCISFFFDLIYLGIWCVKKTKIVKTNIQVNYYCWYALFISVLLANLDVNDYFVSLFFQEIYYGKPYASCVYVLACLLSSLWLLIMVYKIAVYFILNRKIQKSLNHMDFFIDSEDYIIKAKTALGLNKKIRVVIANYIDTPVSYGILNKYILIPNNYEKKYTPDDLYLMLLHELSHIKNGDTIKFRLLNLIECFMWFNPIVYMFCRKFRYDTEFLCDNQVLSVQCIEKERYGCLLLKGCASRNTYIGYGFSDSYHIIKDRIEALYQYKPIKYSFNFATTLLVIVVMIMSSAIHYTHANSININDDYNSVFEICFSSSDFTIYEFVDSSLYDKIYEIKDNTIFINKLVLRELVDENDVYNTITIGSKNFTYKTSQFDFTNGDNYRFNFDKIFNDDGNQFFSFTLSERHPIEYLLLRIANKI